MAGSFPHQLQLLFNPFRIPRQFDVALAFECLAFLGSLHRHRSFPIGDSGAARRAEFLIGQERGEFQRQFKRQNRDLPAVNPPVVPSRLSA